MQEPDIPQTISNPHFLATWANFNGLSTDDGLIVVSSLVAGLMGNQACIRSEAEDLVVRPPHLILPAERLEAGEAWQKLLRMPRIVQDRVVRSASKFQPDVLRMTLRGQHLDPRKKPETSYGQDTVMADHSRALIDDDEKLISPGHLAARAEEDLRVSGRVLRYEALVRPGFLVTRPEEKSLIRLTRECHVGHSMVDVEGDSWVTAEEGSAKWIRLLDGCDDEPTGDSFLDADRQRLRAQLVAWASKTKLQKVLGEGGSALVDRSIWIGLDELPPHHTINGNDLIQATRLLDSTFERVIRERRAWAVPAGDFRDIRKAWQFMKQKRDLLRLMSGQPESANLRGIAALPDTIALGLQTLSGKVDSDDLVLHWAVPVATRQFHRQLDFIKRAAAQEEAKKEEELTSKLLEKIAAKQPVRRRTLMRSFDRQVAAVYHAVIDRLLADGVVLEEPGTGLSLSTSGRRVRAGNSNRIIR